jgi:hypothetical protein
VKQAVEWVNEMAETVVNSMFSDGQPPGKEVEELIKRIQDDARGEYLRKTIQISSVMDSVGKYIVLALCHDGTIWQLANLYRENGKEPYWEPFPIPPRIDGEEQPG